MFKNILETLRPRQWTKNFVIFAGLVFDRQMFMTEPVLRVLAAFITFCMVSGLTYTINDIIDLKADRQHPQKCHRPLASGRLSVTGDYPGGYPCSHQFQRRLLAFLEVWLDLHRLHAAHAGVFQMAEAHHDCGCDGDRDRFPAARAGWH